MTSTLSAAEAHFARRRPSSCADPSPQRSPQPLENPVNPIHVLRRGASAIRRRVVAALSRLLQPDTRCLGSHTNTPSASTSLRGRDVPRTDPAGRGREDRQARWAFSDNYAVIVHKILRGVYYAADHDWLAGRICRFGRGDGCLRAERVAARRRDRERSRVCQGNLAQRVPGRCHMQVARRRQHAARYR